MNSALQVHIAYNAGMQSSGLCFSSFNVDYLNLDYKGKRSMSVLLQKVCTSNLCWTCSILPILRLWPSCSTSEVLREKNCNIERTERRDVINVLKGLSAILKLFITNKTHVDLLPLHQYSKCHQTSISIILCFPRREMPSCSCSSIFKNLSLSLSPASKHYWGGWTKLNTAIQKPDPLAKMELDFLLKEEEWYKILTEWADWSFL